jgi:6-pyruvoyltetrahydropterin/6-carboxytetrahydropterin synthase
MYRLALQRNFKAQHFLIGADWGLENQPHSHDYRLEVMLEGEGLNEHGFLIDLVDFEHIVDSMVEDYAEKLLNDQTKFEGLNPSLEHFARIIASGIAAQVPSPPVAVVSVKLWENEKAWAWYRRELHS